MYTLKLIVLQIKKHLINRADEIIIAMFVETVRVIHDVTIQRCPWLAENKECIIFLMQTYGGTLKETGARYKASYRCTNTRYRDANSVLPVSLCVVRWEEQKKEEGGKRDRKKGGGGFIYLTKNISDPSYLFPVSIEMYLLFIDSYMYASYSIFYYLSQKFEIKREISIISFIHHARTSCLPTISRKIK